MNLTTPPLTPPQDNTLNLPPMNGNRNNMADCAHPKAENFKTISKEIDSKVIPVSDQVAQLPEASMHNGDHVFVSASHADMEPPALIIVEDDEGPEKQEEEKRKDCVSAEENQLQASVEQSAWKERNTVTSPEKGESGAVCSNGVETISTGREEYHTSSEEEEMEEIDLVLVEGAEEEEERGKANGTHLENHVMVGSVEAKGSTSNCFPQSTISSNNVGVIPNASKPALPISNREIDSSKTVRPSASVSPPQEAYAVNSYVFHSNNKGHFVKTPQANVPVISASGGGEAVAREVSQNGRDKFSRDGRRERSKGSPLVCSHQAAKVKQVFTTMQQYANNMGRDVAEQVQELIHAVMVSQ